MKEDLDKYYPNRSMHPHDIAILQRNFEIDNFWKRSNYYLIFNTALFFGVFTDVPAALTIVFCIIGFVSSVMWTLNNIASKFWQERWEIAARDTEPVYFVDKYRLFQDTKPTLIRKVGANLKDKNASRTYIWLMKGPVSVSRLMIVFPGLVVVTWSLIFLLGLFNPEILNLAVNTTCAE